MKKVLLFFASLKLAVFIIVGLAIAQTVATFIESAQSTKAAQYWVYQSFWFYGLMFLLGVNIASVALSRIPWKWKHGPFLMAHLGILILLFGSFVTYKFGVDGALIVSENESSTKVSFEKQVLIVSDGERFSKYYIPWIPPQLKPKKIKIPEFNLSVENYITHADPVYDFIELNEKDIEKKIKSAPAIQFRLKGGPLPFSRMFWLWSGAGEWSQLPLGPARFEILPGDFQPQDLKKLKLDEDQMGRFVLLPKKNGDLHYGIYSKSSEPKIASLKLEDAIGRRINLGWMGMELEIRKFIPEAKNNASYQPARIQKGNEAPPAAIFVQVGEQGSGTSVWMGMDEQIVVNDKDKRLIITFTKEYLNLPFAIKLLKFTIENYLGTNNPAAYSSLVQVMDGGSLLAPVTISMNEPLYYKGYTFYQASFIPGEPRPVTSVFSVNKDPGRFSKYLGSLLIVFGAIWLFSQRYKKRNKGVQSV